MSLRDKVILERTATKVFTEEGYGDAYLKIGTDELDGNEFGESNWYNMGKRQKLNRLSRSIINCVVSR